jgi:hypothetical protein
LPAVDSFSLRSVEKYVAAVFRAEIDRNSATNDQRIRRIADPLLRSYDEEQG